MSNRINLGNIIGATGQAGQNGAKGDKGDKGDSARIVNGVWWVGEINTGVIAKGGEWFTGAGVPTTQGIDNDLYLDTDTEDVYKKENGIWVLKTNIKGQQGQQGIQGANATSIEIGTITTVENDQPASAELIPLGNGAYQLNLSIPKGQQGQQGQAGQNGATTIFVDGFLVNTLAFTRNPQQQLDDKLNKNIGNENKGKYLQVDDDGNIVPVNTSVNIMPATRYQIGGVWYWEDENGKHIWNLNPQEVNYTTLQNEQGGLTYEIKTMNYETEQQAGGLTYEIGGNE